MPTNIAYNMDCMVGMKEYPDNYFDLAVVDPPYGDGLHAESGGGKGWFTKYNMKLRDDDSQYVQVERERERERESRSITDLVGGLTSTSQVSRTGGTWAGKYGKKSLRGM